MKEVFEIMENRLLLPNEALDKIQNNGALGHMNNNKKTRIDRNMLFLVE